MLFKIKYGDILAMAEITKANIEWRDGQLPVSVRFNDPYYSLNNGLAETEHVFINGNNLPSRLTKNTKFHVAELGFGTGLNFLATWKLYKEIAPQNSGLIFSSFEQYPLTKLDIAQALKPFAGIEHFLKLLLEQWPEVVPSEDISISFGSVRLNVYIGDANDKIAALKQPVDAWYLDGFSPAKNPELWGDELMKNVGAKTKIGGSFSTYSAAGWVRERLFNAGFEVERIAGYGRKKHMSIGYKREPVF